MRNPEALSVEVPSPVTPNVSRLDFIEILSLSRSVRYKKNELVIASGAEPGSVYYVEKGAVEVSYTAQGATIVVALIGTGELFGEIGFFDGRDRVRTIKATEDSIIRIWERDRIKDVQRENPLLYGMFLNLMASSICAKFRRILEDREPLTTFAASLSTGRRTFRESKPLPDYLYRSRYWRYVNDMIERFKSSCFDLSFSLQRDSSELIPEDLRDRCHRLFQEFNERLQEFDAMADDPQIKEYMWGLIFKEIFPYFMRSRFAERAFYKPKGYAGDYVMMEMIYLNQPDGDGKLGKLVDEWCLETRAAQAVRARRWLLADLLEQYCQRFIQRRNPLRILNLACGSSRELFDFLNRFDQSELVEAICVDADPEALEYTNQQVDDRRHHASIRLMQDNIVKWALGRVRHNFGSMDIIYSSGLTDYLDNRLFVSMADRCYDYLQPGGVFIVGNFGGENPNRAFMDNLLHWNLIHRDEQELKNLFAQTRFNGNVTVLAEPNHVNLFAVAEKNS